MGIKNIIGMERLSGNIVTPTPQDIARILNVSVEEVRQCIIADAKEGKYNAEQR